MTRRNPKLLSYNSVGLLIDKSGTAVRGKNCKSSYSYDPSFPKPLKLGPRTVRFRESDILDWIEAKARAGINGASTEGAA